MTRYKWEEISADDVVKAIEIFDSEETKYPKSRTTFLLYGGREYPAKHIRGMAYNVHFGVEINKGDFSGGKETVRFFEKLGFDVKHMQRSTKAYSKKAEPFSSEENVGMSDDKTKRLQEDDRENMRKTSTYVSDKSEKGEKTRIPAKGVIEQKNALQLILNKLCDGDIVCEKTFPWMKTPSVLSDEYKKLIDALSAYRGNTGFPRKNVTLRCDFVCEHKKLIIEYDERQHFSEARRVSLLSYPEVMLHFDRQKWIEACQDIQAKDNQPPERDEIRAYYDSTRDIEAAKHGYRLIRIMHGQLDFEKDGAEEELRHLLGIDVPEKTEKRPELKQLDYRIENPIKIGLYLQTTELQGNIKTFNKAMDIVRSSDIDILVFPEFSYFPFVNEYQSCDFMDGDCVQALYEKSIELSRDIGRAIVICNEDNHGIIMSIYANAFAGENETICKDYIKHTMTSLSACEIENYSEYAEYAFQPINFKGHKIGLTICYDCNHSVFSRKYALNGVDIILNSTGGDVVYDKWYKYNKARAIENHCFTFVTMGGMGSGSNPHNYVFGFTPEGKEMHPVLLNGEDKKLHNVPGGIYVYDTAEDDGKAEVDPSITQRESINKNSDLYIPANDISSFVKQGTAVSKGIMIRKIGDVNLVMCVLNKHDIMKPEKVLKLLYANELKRFRNKKYLIINWWDAVDEEYFRTKLSSVLKVRAMENYCAVLIASNNITKCYQCGMNRTAQVVKEVDGKFGIDLSRAGGPETIWKNKNGMKANWRKNIEWIIDSM